MSEIQVLWYAVGSLSIGMGLMGLALCHSIYHLRQAVIGIQRMVVNRTNEQMGINQNLIQSTKNCMTAIRESTETRNF
jgi:hypothetical protein